MEQNKKTPDSFLIQFGKYSAILTLTAGLILFQFYQFMGLILFIVSMVLFVIAITTPKVFKPLHAIFKMLDISSNKDQ